MPPPAAATDIYTAIAEPTRRELLRTLARRGPSAVLTLAATLALPQPAVSKHLAVLRQVGLVSVDRRGRERIYSIEAQELRTVHDWTGEFERLWTDQLDRIKQRAERRAARQDRPHPSKENG